MTDTQKKIGAIFEAAAALETEPQRREYLARACPDSDIRSEVESLLEATNRPDSLFSDGEATSAQTLDEARPSEQAGTRIGRYKLLEKLGEGGFGSVWAAEQKEPVKRRVALKIIKLGMDTRQVVARFEAERQALALMDHPNIAKVLDAGATDNGRPYFVMELVKGVPITRYCQQERLSTNEQLDLFIKVCQAIQHAHQKGIIHRDIKPSNIMVTLHDGVPVPKVIDFGIAKATQQELTDKTIYTQYSQFIGTPAYMSPEQAEMSGLDIDTRSDIYSLGVLLYELLTGAPPFESHELMQSGLDEMRKIIREREPVRPSTRVTQASSDPQSRIINHRSKIENDLDWIVMKCLEKDRTRRYETANGVVSDIRRHLESEPIVARPPSFAYRFQKAFRRNRLAYASGISVAAVLLVAVIGTSVGMVRAERERAAAEEARGLAEERFQSARRFVDSLVNEVAPEFQGLIGASKAKEALARASVAFLESMGDGSDTEVTFQLELAKLYSDMADALGSVYSPNSVGDHATALKFARKSLAILKDLVKRQPDNESAFEAMTWALDQTGNLLAELDQGMEAMNHFTELKERIDDRLASKPEDAQLLWHKNLTQNRMGHIVSDQGRIEDALEDYYLPASAGLLELRPDPSLPTGKLHDCYVAHILVGSSLFKLNRFSESGRHFEMASAWKRILIEREPNNARHARDWADMQTWTGSQLIKEGKHEEGMMRHDAAIKLFEELVGRDPANGMAQRSLANAMRWQAEGRAATARDEQTLIEDRTRLWREAVEILQRCNTRLDSPEMTVGRGAHPHLKEEVASAIKEAHSALAELENRHADRLSPTP